MTSPITRSSIELRNRFDDLRKDVQTFKQSFDVLLSTIASLEHDAGFIDAEKLMRMSETCSAAREDVTAPLLTQERSNLNSRLQDLPDVLTARWKGEMAPAKTSKSPNLRSDGSSRLTKLRLHDRWDHLYLGNEAAIMEAEHNEYELVHRRSNLYARSLSITDGVKQVHIHPFSFGRITWDILGVCLVALDITLLPVSIAWDIQIRVGSFQHYMLTTNIIYWSLDIALAFNTAFIDKSGTVITSRKHVTLNYISGWFAFDAITVLVDCCLWLFVSTNFLAIARGVRMNRVLRVIRAVRVFKLMNLSKAIDRLNSVRGRQALILILAFLRTISGILGLAHVLACVWYAIGKAQESDGQASWVSLLQDRDELVDEYMQSLSWTLGYLTANSVEGSISPQSLPESVFYCIITLTSLVVLGCGIGKITETMLAIERLDAEATRAKRLLDRFLKANKVSVGLRVRVISFVLYRIRQKSDMMLDPSIQELLPSTLSAELLVSQRLSHIISYPLFYHFYGHHSNVMVHLCKAFDTRDFAEDEFVFVHSTWADSFIVTRKGEFLHVGDPEEDESGNGDITKADPTNSRNSNHSVDGTTQYKEVTYFAEYSLYAKAVHPGSLQALTMGDTLEISGQNFAEAIKHNPSCIALTYKYAHTFIQKANEIEYRKPGSISSQIMREILSNIQLYKSAAEGLREAANPQEQHERFEYLESVYDRLVNLEEIKERLDWIFPEFGDSGIYLHFGEKAECNRCKCAILSVIYLHFGAYEAFTAVQPSDTRLTLDQWAELQDIYESLTIQKDQFCAALVLLAIRGLAKIEAIVKSVPVHMRDPASTVSSLMADMPQFVPSTIALEEDMKLFISQILRVNTTFNMSQFLQGENNPSQIKELTRLLHEAEYKGVFTCTLLVFLGVMSSLRGASVFHSSAHMDKHNAAAVLLAIRCLQQLEHQEPQKLYWSFIKSRAAQFSMPAATIEDFVLARLACLIRATRNDSALLVMTWASLADFERAQLTRHFLADGIIESAILFSFLPTYLTNAKNSLHFGLSRALTLLVDILEQLDASGQVPKEGINTTCVNLQSLASFILEVNNARDIEFLGAHITFVQHGTILHANVSRKMYRKLRDYEWHYEAMEDKEIAYTLKRLERNTGEQERSLSLLTRSAHINEKRRLARSVHDKDATSTHAARHEPHRSVHSVTAGEGRFKPYCLLDETTSGESPLSGPRATPKIAITAARSSK